MAWWSYRRRVFLGSQALSRAAEAAALQSVDPARVASNADVWSFELDAAQLAALDAIETKDGSQRFCWDPTGVA